MTEEKTESLKNRGEIRLYNSGSFVLCQEKIMYDKIGRNEYEEG